MAKKVVNSGDRFGKLTIIKEIDNPISGRRRFLCRCDCGNKKEIDLIRLTTGKTKSCGRCNYKEIHIGDKFGMWEVIGGQIQEKGGFHKSFLCRCSCEKHTERYVDRQNLISWKSLSCGCNTAKETKRRMTKHGKAGTRLFNVWAGMRERCNCKTNAAYKSYGGRGIKICEEWNNFEVFEKWALDNGYDETAPHGECTLDRIDVDGNYEPSNCRWISMSEQADNRRNSIKITYNGKTQTMREWSKELGISYNRIRARYAANEPIEMVFSKEPLKQGKIYIEYNGETHSIKEWSKITGLSRKMIQDRHYKGLEPELIFMKANLRGRSFEQLRKEM